MPVFHKDGKTVLFVHIPKAGGTFIEALFKRSGYEIEFLAHGKNRGYLNTVMHISPQHLHLDVLKTVFDFPKFDFIFTVVRNPIDRFTSEFKMRNKQGGVSINDWAELALNSHAKNPASFDNHIRPQSDFVDDSVRWYKLEEKLDENWAKSVNEQFGLGLKTHDLSPAHKGVKDEHIGKENLMLSEAMRKKLYDFYHQDFKKFGY